MNFWEALLLTVGGNAVLLAIVAWFARSLTSQVLAKDLEKFKGELASASVASAARLQHDLQRAALEHQVRFSRFHERRAEVIADLSSLLVESQWACESFASPMEFVGEPSKQEKYVTAHNKVAEFYRFFDKNRLWLPVAVSTELEALNRRMRREVLTLDTYLNKVDQHAPAHVIKEKFEAWNKASTYFTEEFPKARAALENEFRRIMGASEETARGELNTVNLNS